MRSCTLSILYDRTHTRLITYYRGMTQIIPLFSLLLFVLCLGNMGVPLTLNFVGELLALYGAFDILPIVGVLACSSIVFSAAFFSPKREFVMLIALIIPAVLFGQEYLPCTYPRWFTLFGFYFNL
jgi:NADH:ubiquinone oxidoreductase subunit 4 (subunit M)